LASAISCLGGAAYHGGDDTTAAMVTSLSPLTEGREISWFWCCQRQAISAMGATNISIAKSVKWCQVGTPSWCAAVRFLRLIFLSPYQLMSFIE